MTLFKAGNSRIAIRTMSVAVPSAVMAKSGPGVQAGNRQLGSPDLPDPPVCQSFRDMAMTCSSMTRKDTGQMTIRDTTPADYGRIQEIYACAREQMRRAGNPGQWGDSRPSGETLLKDIRQRQSHVMEEQGQICGVFTFIIGEAPTYRIIEQGQWLDDAPYGTIHRIAGNGAGKGIFRECLSYCLAQIPNIRIDTHRDNAVMRHLLEKHGFVKCGIIYVEDGSPRIAYQRCCVGVMASPEPTPLSAACCTHPVSRILLSK